MVLFIAQLLCGTSLLFAELVACYFAIAVMLYLRLDGLATINGLAVTSMTLKTVIIAELAKTLMWQTGDSNLVSPEATMKVLAVGLAVILCAAIAATHFPVKVPVIRRNVSVPYLSGTALVATFLGPGAKAVAMMAGGSGGVSAVLAGLATNFAFCSMLSIAAATAAVVVKSNRQSSMSWFSMALIASAFFSGLLGASKQGMFEPIVTYVIACLGFGFKFRRRHVATGLLVGLVSVFILVPYAQLSRRYSWVVSGNGGTNGGQGMLGGIIDEPEELLDLFGRYQNSTAGSGENSYYGRPMGLLDRFSVINNTDILITSVLERGDVGLSGIFKYFSFLPKSLSDEPTEFSLKGDFLAKYAGMIDEGDATTGMTFGVLASTFAFGGWVGTVFLTLPIFFLFFLANRYIVGGIRNNVWAVTLAVLLQHTLTEMTIAYPLFYLFRSLPFLLIYKFASDQVATSSLLTWVGVKIGNIPGAALKRRTT